MNRKSQIVFLIAAGALILVYFFPIWSIQLQAPQYPEGIGMLIWAHDITGKNAHDLGNINRLNHYIGMKEIHPQSIPELKIIPPLIGFLIVFGLVGAILKKRLLLYIWLALFLILLLAGMVDFYLWGYDYGHDLNPMAPIKVPGMVYQPPLIGSKQLLNMQATSLPHIGAWVMVFSITLGFMAAWWAKKGKEGHQKP
jgi:copper chaperone NosL